MIKTDDLQLSFNVIQKAAAVLEGHLSSLTC